MWPLRPCVSSAAIRIARAAARARDGYGRRGLRNATSLRSLRLMMRWTSGAVCIAHVTLRVALCMDSVVVAAAASWTPAVVSQPTLHWQPRSDWVSVVTACGAKGDGKSDDTAAIQKCLGNMTSGSVVHFPPGTYRITDTLEVGCQNKTIDPAKKGQCGIIAGQFYGHGAATILEWDGAVNGTMFWSHGVTMSRYIGFHFDCKGLAKTAIEHMSETLYETETLHEVHRFSNCVGAAVNVDPVEHVATAEMLFHNVLWENNAVGLQYNSFNDYDNTIDGCLFRNNGIGINTGSGNSYVRNSRFENSSSYDYGSGWVFWLFSTIHRCVSVGSDQFIKGGAGTSIGDCHVDSWMGGEPNPKNKSDWNPGDFGPDFNLLGAAIDMSGQTQVHDCTFSNPRCTEHMGVQDAQCCGMMGGQGNKYPFISSNNTMLTSGFNLTDHHGKSPQYYHPGNNSIYDNRNMSDASNKLHSPGKCPATGITSDTNFYKSQWPIPGKIFEVGSYLPPVNKTDPQPPTTEQMTAAVQACINAAAKVGKGSMAYFPKGTYELSSTIEITGRDFYIGGCGYQTIFSWRGPVVNTTAGAPRNVTAEQLAVMMKVTGGTQVTIETLQLFPAAAGDDVVRLLIEGSSGTEHIGSALEDVSYASAAAAACTDVTINGLELDAYNEAMRSFTSGVRAVNLAKCDTVDVIAIDGDIHTIGNSGTILVGFHTAGQVKIEPAKPADESASSRATVAVPVSTGELGFFGEMMRFTCCTEDFTTKLIGPQTYVVEAFYQESGNFEFHLTDDTPNKSGQLTGTLTKEQPDEQTAAATGLMAINGIKHFTMFAQPHSLLEGWTGDALFTGGLFSTQTEDCPGKEEGGESKCNMTIIVNGSGATNLAYVGTQPWNYPMTIDISGQGKHTLTQYGNLWTNASGPFPLGYKPNADPSWQPAGMIPANLIPDQVVEGVSAEVVRNGLDGLRRLARLDLARHYPELGVTDICAGN